MKIKFTLRKEKINKDGLIPIKVTIRHSGYEIRKNTGLNTLEKHWDGHRVKPNLKSEKKNNSSLINSKLQNIENKIYDIIIYFEANKVSFSIEKFNDLFDNKQETTEASFNFFECFEEYINVGKLTKSPNTTKGQNTIKVFLQDFQKDTGYKIEFEKVDNFFFEELMKYAYEVREIKNNYFAKVVKVLKSLLKWCDEKGYNKNRYYEKFKAPEHDIDIIYLTFEELIRLYNLKFENSRLEHARDFYCMGCFTGLIFSDLSRLHLANISEDHIILSIQKTKTQNHAIKLNKYAKAILDKYKGTIYEPLPSISSQKFNDYIKECCELAEITQSFTIHWFVGNQKKSLTQPKYKFITSHTARKTFITNSLLLGMEPKVIKKIANIKKDAVLDKYMKVTEAFTDEQMDKAWNK